MKYSAPLALAAMAFFATATAQEPFTGPQYPDNSTNTTQPDLNRPRGTPLLSELTSLHEFFQAKGKLYLGTTSDRFLLTNGTDASLEAPDLSSAVIVNKVFGQLTAENSMKWESTEPEPDVFTLDDADFLVTYALERRIALRGHTLVWHSQLPPWVENITDADELTRVIQNHIAKVMGRYKGLIRSWVRLGPL